MKKTSIVMFLLFVLLLTGCTKPVIQDTQFANKYVEYNEMPVINFKINNPTTTTFTGKVAITAVTSSGYFDCYQSTQKDIDPILPGKYFNGEVQIATKNNINCKGKDFIIYVVIKDKLSDATLAQTKLEFSIKN